MRIHHQGSLTKTLLQIAGFPPNKVFKKIFPWKFYYYQCCQVSPVSPPYNLPHFPPFSVGNSFLLCTIAFIYSWINTQSDSTLKMHHGLRWLMKHFGVHVHKKRFASYL